MDQHGASQGCVMSPWLFNILMPKMSEEHTCLQRCVGWDLKVCIVSSADGKGSPQLTTTGSP